LLDWDRKLPDAGLVFSLVGIQYLNASMAESITTIPDNSSACTVAAERISVAPFTCARVAEQELKNYKRTPLLPIYTVYTDVKEPTSSVSLIDSPPDCLVIGSYVEYGWRDPMRRCPPLRRSSRRPSADDAASLWDGSTADACDDRPPTRRIVRSLLA